MTEVKIACRVWPDSDSAYFAEYRYDSDAVSSRPLSFCNLECTVFGGMFVLGRYR